MTFMDRVYKHFSAYKYFLQNGLTSSKAPFNQKIKYKLQFLFLDWKFEKVNLLFKC